MGSLIRSPGFSSAFGLGVPKRQPRAALADESPSSTVGETEAARGAEGRRDLGGSFYPSFLSSRVLLSYYPVVFLSQS